MSDVVIRAVGLGKQYRIGHQQERYKTLRHTLSNVVAQPLRAIRSARDDKRPVKDSSLWALDDVSFEICRGEAVGIIGPNGAGKTTLLKILSRTTKPTRGYVDIRGRVGSLLEVGTGFHPELTGRENVYLYGSILGMKRLEIDAKFDEIVAFAEVDRLLDTPVKHYSTGMQMRLAFAVAAHLEPEILLIDEALAVGDIDFQRKCVGSLESIARSGRTVVFVSHSMGLVESLCGSALLLHQGRIESSGPVKEVVADYLTLFNSPRPVNLLQNLRSGLSSQRRFTSLVIKDHAGIPVATLPVGAGICLQVGVWTKDLVRQPWFVFEIRTSLDQLIFHCASREAGYDLDMPAGQSIVECSIPNLNLLPGDYVINLQWWDAAWTLYDEATRAGTFTIREADVFETGAPLEQFHGLVFFNSAWKTYADLEAES